MFKRKRGDFQTDWAISLGIFLIFLGWFFVFTKPLYGPEYLTPNTGSIRSGLLQDVSWSIDKVPIIIYSNVSGNVPVVLDFPYSWNESSFAFTDDSYKVLDEGRLLFIPALGVGSNLLWLAHSNETYTNPDITLDLVADSTNATVTDMRAEFSSSLLNRVMYNGTYRVNSVRYYLNGKALTGNSVNRQTAIAARYGISNEVLNHTAYVFAGSTRIPAYVTMKQQGDYSLTISAELSGYSKYYADNLYQGSMTNADIKCNSFSRDHVDFYSTDGVMFYASSPAAIKICYSNSTVVMNATFALPANYTFIFHPGDHTDVVLEPYSAIYGAKDVITGISVSKLYALNTTYGYDALKDRWIFPSTREFGVRVER